MTHVEDIYQLFWESLARWWQVRTRLQQLLEEQYPGGDEEPRLKPALLGVDRFPSSPPFTFLSLSDDLCLAAHTWNALMKPCMYLSLHQ